MQIPPRGVWGKSGRPVHVPLDHWLGGMSAPALTVEDLVLRYLAAYGPATAKDVQTWCGLTRLGEVVERLGSRVIRLWHEDGHELIDLPDAPRPDPDVPAPVRFLYDFDNVMLSYADRSRMSGTPPPDGLYTQHGPLPGAVLVDGVSEGGWMINRNKEQHDAPRPVRRPPHRHRPCGDHRGRPAPAVVPRSRRPVPRGDDHGVTDPELIIPVTRRWC